MNIKKITNKVFHSNFLKFFINILFPRICLHCKNDIHYLDKNILCPPCHEQLKKITMPRCAKCGQPIDSGEHCYSCRKLKTKPKCSFIRSAFIFNEQMRSVIHEYKYINKPYLSKTLGLWMREDLKTNPEFKEFRFLLAVPLAKKKLAQRGFNQSELLADGMAVKKDFKVIKNAITRTKNTASQTTLNKEERKTNISNAFSISKPELIKGKNIILIDDVATTGNTLEELAKTLKKAGARKVAAFTLAREV
ncbi:MAG: ComF family protein [Elusimicrobiales bacterium]|nr:ComF family protein [Elusimicrobiales bacterium]